MKTIIRIEHSDGNGLWRAGDEENQCDYCDRFTFFDELSEKHEKFPNPYNDGIIGMRSDDYCAFKSIEQIQEWIEPEWFNEIIELGFKILMLEVSKYKEGEYQIVFKKEDIVSTKDITSLFVNKIKTKQ